MKFVYEQDKSSFIFDYLNKKFGRKECGYNIIVIDDKLRSCELNIRRSNLNDVLKICEVAGIEVK
jgi:hypothetical protein